MVTALLRNLAAATAVFSREGVRNARRWQTYALRVLFSAVILGVVLLMLVDAAGGAMDPAGVSRLGRDLFMLYAGLQMFVACLLAPMLVGLGISEEQDDRTLELLAITPLTPRQILWGKVSSRLLLLVTVVLGATPVMALIVSFGGVGVWEVVNTAVNTVAVVVVLGALGGVLAVSVRGPVAGVVGGFAYLVPAMFVVPAGYTMAVHGNEKFIGHLSPMLAMYQDSAVGLLPALAFLPVVALVLRWGGPLFALAAVEDSDEGAGSRLSAEFWQLERHRRRLGWLGLVLALGTPVCVAVVYGASNLGGPRASLALQAVAWGWSVLVLVAGTGLFLLLVARAAETVRHFKRLRDVVSGVDLTHLPLAAARRLNPLRRWVWPNPVAWREVVTHGLGPAGFIARWGFLGWVCFNALAFVADEDAGAYWTVVTGTMATAFFTLALATGSMARERAGRTLPLLLSTTLSTVGVVSGKLFSVALYALPYGLVGWLVFGLYLGIDRQYMFFYDAAPPTDMCGQWSMGAGVPMLQAAGVGAWLLAVWGAFAVGCMITAARLQPAKLAWGLNIGAGCAFFVVPIVLDEFLRGRFTDDLAHLWWPLGQHGFGLPYCGVSPGLLVSTAGWGLLAAVLFVVLCVRLRPWVASGRG